MSVDNTATGLSIVTACIADVRRGYLQIGLQLNRNKSEAVVVGAATVCRRLVRIIYIRRRCGSSGG